MKLERDLSHDLPEIETTGASTMQQHDESLSHGEIRSGKLASDVDESEIKRLNAKREALEAEFKLEQQKLESIKRQNKIQRRNERRDFLAANLTPKRAITILGAIVVVVLVGAFAVSQLFKEETKPVTITSSQLEEIVTISKLSTAEYVYNGIAEVKNEDGEVTQRIYYGSTVRAGVDMSKIKFDIDDEAKLVYPILPEITLDDPSVDESSFEYMPTNPDMKLNDIISVCKKDARTEIEKKGQIYDTAEEGLRTAVEALTLPVLENADYRISWDEPPADNDRQPDKADGQEVTTNEQ
ncbi:DUF4230 domain-containing protein [Collinsella tanakaei]|uniref:DUF4230 domain-containing protein n=1 Tax=Collinsella tanakaei TaxID=626935 RepID=UPI001F3D568E|nr:DUF4230 domain-containing protein [Collinsella tanakaei]MCF2621338.1 DUF4230 domain-containing protein [Collinsella tanakaei]